MSSYGSSITGTEDIDWAALEAAYAGEGGSGWAPPIEPEMFGPPDPPPLPEYYAPEPAMEPMYAPNPDVYAPPPVQGPEPIYPDPYVPDPAFAWAPEPENYDPLAAMQFMPESQNMPFPPPLPGTLDPWESPGNFTEDEAFSTINGQDIGGGGPPLGDPIRPDWPGPVQAAGTGRQPFFNNPVMQEQDVRFDATTDPANRGQGPGLLGGLQNLREAGDPYFKAAQTAAGNFSENLIDTVNPYGFQAPTPSGYVGPPRDTLLGDIGEEATKLVVPGSTFEAGLTAAPVIGDLGAVSRYFDDAARAGERMATRGFGTNLDTLPDLASFADEALAPVRALGSEAGMARIPGGAPEPLMRLPNETDLEYAVRLRTSGADPAQVRALERGNAEAAGKAAKAAADARRAAFEAKPVESLTDLPNATKTDLDLEANPAEQLTHIASTPVKPATRAKPDIVDQAESRWLGLEDAVQQEREAAIREFGTVAENDQWAQQAARQRAYAPPPGPPKPPAPLAPMPWRERAWDEFVTAVGLPRSLKASFDLSAPGRQGLALAFRHPKEWAKAWAPMLRAWASEPASRAVEADMQRMLKMWEDATGTKSPVHLYEVGAGSNPLERVPGFEPLGTGVIGSIARRIPIMSRSERAYATFLNVQKMTTFDTMGRALRKAGETNPEAFKNLGNIIDHATGYGGMPLGGRGLGAQALFSQRYFSSRIQFLTDPITEGLIKGDMRAAKAATENLVSFMGGMAGLLYLGNETGAWDTEFDPRNTDFGKVRVGPQRIDFGAGFIPLIRTAARMYTGEAISAAGNMRETNAGEEALRFLRNKLAPIPGEVVTQLLGEDAIGDPAPKILSLDMAKNLFMPLIADSVLEAFKGTGGEIDLENRSVSGGDPLAMARAGVSELFGGGTQTYGEKQDEANGIAEERFGMKFQELPPYAQAEINKERLDAGEKLPDEDVAAPYTYASSGALRLTQSTFAGSPVEQKSREFLGELGLGTYNIMDYESISKAEDAFIELAMQTARVDRIVAMNAWEDYRNSVLDIDKKTRQLREDAIAVDPRVAKAVIDLYNSGNPDYTRFKPGDWVVEAARKAK
jgi:hypothetical protein